MSTVTTSTAVNKAGQKVPLNVGFNSANGTKMDASATSYNDWRDDLARDGYAIIKGAVPRERADKYADAMYSWLEGL